MTNAEYLLILARQAARQKKPTAPAIPTPPSRKSEADIQGEIEDYLRGLGHVCWFTRSRMDCPTTNRPGTPDFIGILRGVPFTFEVKRPGCKETREQAGELLWFGLAGGTSAIVHSLAEAVATIAALPSSKPVAGLEAARGVNTPGGADKGHERRS